MSLSVFETSGTDSIAHLSAGVAKKCGKVKERADASAKVCITSKVLEKVTVTAVPNYPKTDEEQDRRQDYPVP